jgi:predicted acylesterase/phospholipase RssA
MNTPSPSANCTACRKIDTEPHPIGRPGEPIRALAFGAGGVDAVMQLGVAHALIVADAKPPDVVVGISTGAVTACALGEILSAGAGLDTAPRKVARLSRFRELLYAAQELKGELMAAIAPDMYEADAGRVLEPHHLAIHFEDERKARQEALRARSGLVQLINSLVTLRITFGTLVRFIRCYLGWEAAAELQDDDRVNVRTVEIARFVRTLLWNFVACVQLVAALLIGAVQGGEQFKSRKTGKTAGDIVFRYAGLARLGVLLFWTATTIVFALTVWLAVWLLREIHDYWPWSYFAITLAVLIATFAWIRHVPPETSLVKRILVWIRDRNLAKFDLLQDLASPYFLRDFFVRNFDREYYGRTAMGDVVEAALSPEAIADEGRPRDTTMGDPRKKLEYYLTRAGVRIVPMVGDLRTGGLKPLPADTAVVDALRASTAALPLFRAEKMGKDYYIDGSNVSNEPVMALVNVLRESIDKDVTAAYVYSVSHLPVETEALGQPDARRYSGLVDVTLRARELQAFRHSRLERQLVRLYTKVLPAHRNKPEVIESGMGELRALHCFGPDAEGKERHYIRAEIFPIEPPQAREGVAERLIRARSVEDEQRVILESVAEGCRLTLEAIMPQSIRAVATAGTATCAAALRQRLGLGDADELPGVSEICNVCIRKREEGGGGHRALGIDRRTTDTPLPEWPRAGAAEPEPVIRESPTPPPALSNESRVNLLFSGGVFRGVFLVGVLNALNELGVKPHLIAGSSVGSITAAMAARVFSDPPDERRGGIVKLAATFLAVDHLIVTDRFADFVRRLTLRAAESNFSLRDVDRFLRRYDLSDAQRFADTARSVVAGLEHLLYVSPWELEALVRAVRLRKSGRAIRLLGLYFQELLDRGGVGLEVLGTEPLALLIRQHVFTEEQRRQDPASILIDAFKARGIEFLATATNLPKGELEIIGKPDRHGRLRSAVLVESLLASSAFPGVFRPRWGWEIFPDATSREQFIDGGVMDNLPLKAVVDSLVQSASRGAIARRPATGLPHLLFTASLESDVETLDDRELERIATRWPAAYGRAKRMQYNKKVDQFALVQDDMRRIYDAYVYSTEEGLTPAHTPLDLSVVVVKPKWLCSTFAFHPMLGFRRRKQAASIAHGCASTFAKLVQIYNTPRGPAWTTAWGMDVKRLQMLDGKHFRVDPSTNEPVIEPSARTNYKCHFSEQLVCPFAIGQGVDDRHKDTKEALASIYFECGKRATHQRQPA